MRFTAIVGVLTMVMLSGDVAAAQETDAAAVPPIRVRVLDCEAVRSRAWAFAETVVSTIYRKAGLTINWAHDQADVVGDPLRDITVMVMTGHPSESAAKTYRVADRVLAFVPGTEGNRGRLAFVLNDRIAELSGQSGMPYSLLLGRVLAHEIGHVLLPFSAHSRTGLMRESVDAMSRPLRLEFFTDDQAAIIRSRLVNSARPDGRMPDVIATSLDLTNIAELE